MAARSRHRITWRALRVAAGGLVVGGVVAGAGVAGAAQQAADATIATDNSTAFMPPDVSSPPATRSPGTSPRARTTPSPRTRSPADPNWAGLRDAGPQHRHVRVHVHAARDVRVPLQHPLARDARDDHRHGRAGRADADPHAGGDASSIDADRRRPQPPALRPGPARRRRHLAARRRRPVGAARDGAAPAISGLRLKAIRRRARITPHALGDRDGHRTRQAAQIGQGGPHRAAAGARREADARRCAAAG